MQLGVLNNIIPSIVFNLCRMVGFMNRYKSCKRAVLRMITKSIVLDSKMGSVARCVLAPANEDVTMRI